MTPTADGQVRHPAPAGPVLVTGANRGIGLAVATHLVNLGHVVFLGCRDPQQANRAAHRMGPGALPLTLDVDDPSSIARALESVEAHGMGLDVLINNAGINYDTWNDPVSPDFTSVEATLRTNAIGAWRVSSAAARMLRHSGRGRIVNVSSGAGSLAGMGSGSPGYSVSKAALNAVTRVLAAALRDDGVLVNSVCPGWVATDMGGAGGRPPEDAVPGIVWAATLPDDGPTGGFFRDTRPIPW